MPAMDKIKEALDNMEESLLKANLISSLNRGKFHSFKEFITDSELSELEALNEPNTSWEKPEEFMLNLLKIPNSKSKIIFWNFHYEYPDNYNLILNPVNFLKSVRFI